MRPHIQCLALLNIFVAALSQNPNNVDTLNLAYEVFGRPPNTTVIKLTADVDANKDTTNKNNNNNEGEISLNPTKLKPGEASNADCLTPEGQKGTCVSYYQCDPKNRKVITDGNTLIDVRQGQCHYLEWCCLLEEVKEAQPKVPKPIKPSEKPRPLPKCGYSNPGALNIRIVNDGTQADHGEYPWMIAVLKNSPPNSPWVKGDYIGGGAIIHPKVVLTGAHKVDGMEANELKCRAGEWDTQTDLELYPHQERNVQKIIMHEDFFRPSVIYNIGLLILEQPFIISYETPHIGVACIAHRMPIPNTKCQTMGWGLADFKNPDKYAVILKKIELKLESRPKCQNALRGTRLGSRFQLHQSLLCAGGEAGVDACSGDGGSPLVCPIGSNEDRSAIVGTVAWGIGCGEEGIPGVYANIPDFRSWIADKFKAEGLDPKSFEYDE